MGKKEKLKKKFRSDPEPYPFFHETDPQIWIQIRMKRTHDTESINQSINLSINELSRNLLLRKQTKRVWIIIAYYFYKTRENNKSINQSIFICFNTSFPAKINSTKRQNVN